MTRGRTHDLWRRFVNLDYVDLLEAFGFGRTFVRAEGAKLFDEDATDLPVPWEVVAKAVGNYDPGKPPDFMRHILSKWKAPS
ncbi:MAG: hypothetical protein E3J64_06340 [Anaerolineales bacterium]|nr:MAG: hypothetical protein E3J64_06340 [Anaerolineales bacterium]